MPACMCSRTAGDSATWVRGCLGRVDNPKHDGRHPDLWRRASLHDYVVQAAGAFDETVRGILNLGQLRQRIEIRVVVHKQTAPYLAEIAEFIARNLTFVDQVALMGLEMIGFARANIENLWIDPVDYQQQLIEAVRDLIAGASRR